MENEELNTLFESASNNILDQNDETHYDYGDEVLKNLEQTYKGEVGVHEQRQTEKVALEKELKETKSKLNKAKNIKNHRKTTINTKIAENRKLYKNRITEIKDLLYNIDLEEKGSQISSSDLVDTTIKENSTK
ncbi:MAG TPA: hypothetical protein PKD85_00315 [Saprospiraceae bacterium]|nr:hypothetical protein [Saprospiraceae bacterium]